MRKRTVVAMAVLFCMSLARCECRVSTGDLSVRIQDAKLARDQGGNQSTTVFSPADTFWCLVEVSHPEASTLVEAKWYAVEAAGIDGEQLIDSKGMAGENEDLKFSLIPSSPFPPGRYRVDLLLDGKLDRTLEFEVRTGD